MLRVECGPTDRLESVNRPTRVWPLTFDEVQKQFSDKQKVFSTNGAGSIVHPRAQKEQPLIQQLMLTGSYVKCKM